MAVNLSPIGNGQQFFDNTGLPLNGGLIYTYQAGSTTPLATYTDINGTVANSNPIVLDSSGRLPNEVWLTYGFFYKFVVKTSAAVTLGTYDNLYGIIGVANTSTGTTIPTGMISLWYGSIGSVPLGWYLCDGTNGTPDLRDNLWWAQDQLILWRLLAVQQMQLWLATRTRQLLLLLTPVIITHI